MRAQARAGCDSMLLFEVLRGESHSSSSSLTSFFSSAPIYESDGALVATLSERSHLAAVCANDRERAQLAAFAAYFARRAPARSSRHDDDDYDARAHDRLLVRETTLAYLRRLFAGVRFESSRLHTCIEASWTRMIRRLDDNGDDERSRKLQIGVDRILLARMDDILERSASSVVATDDLFEVVSSDAGNVEFV
jgi:hypothetical protein